MTRCDQLDEITFCLIKPYTFFDFDKTFTKWLWRLKKQNGGVTRCDQLVTACDHVQKQGKWCPNRVKLWEHGVGTQIRPGKKLSFLWPGVTSCYSPLTPLSGWCLPPRATQKESCTPITNIAAFSASAEIQTRYLLISSLTLYHWAIEASLKITVFVSPLFCLLYIYVYIRQLSTTNLTAEISHLVRLRSDLQLPMRNGYPVDTCTVQGSENVICDPRVFPNEKSQILPPRSPRWSVWDRTFNFQCAASIRWPPVRSRARKL